MNDILIIARREFLQFIRTRGFILTLLLVPGWVIIGGGLRQVAQKTEPVRHFAVVDETGRYAAAIDGALADQGPRAGEPRLAPASHLLRIAAPPELATAARAHDEAALEPYFSGARKIVAADGSPGLFALAVIPREFSPAAPRFEYWSENQTDPAVRDFLRGVLIGRLQLETAALSGLDAAATQRLLATDVVVEPLNPANTATRGAVSAADQLRMMFPFIVALLLILAILSIASMLLMAVVEEKSNRVVEMILASTSANRLMAGKLVGAGAAALLMMAGWVVGGGSAASALHLASPGAVVTALARAHALGDLPAIAVCFVCGLAIHTMIFLGVGAMSRSFQEAQSYLGPLMFVLFAPAGLLFTVLKDPNGIIGTLLSFSPLHAPFFLMIRLPHDPPPVETAVAFLWMVACTLAIARLMALGFARHILSTDQPPSLWARLARLWRRRHRPA